MTTREQVAGRTIDRLLGYYPFDDAVLEAVSDTAQEQFDKQFTEMTSDFGVEDGPKIFHPNGASKPIQVLEVGTPQGAEKSDTRNVVHAAFGSSLDNFTRMRAIRFTGALWKLRQNAGEPIEQVTFLGGTRAKGRGVGKLTVGQMVSIARTHDLRPTIDAGMRYLQQSGVSVTNQFGWSLACDKVHTAVQYCSNYDIEIERAIGSDSATVVERSFPDLIRAFKSTGIPMPRYIAQTESPAFHELWSKDNMWEAIKYHASLARPSNVAVAWALKYDGYEGRLQAALESQPNAIFTEAWGTASELTDTAAMVTALRKFPQVFQMMIKDMHHAGMEDIDLFAAIMLQGLRNGHRLSAVSSSDQNDKDSSLKNDYSMKPLLAS